MKRGASREGLRRSNLGSCCLRGHRPWREQANNSTGRTRMRFPAELSLRLMDPCRFPDVTRIRPIRQPLKHTQKVWEFASETDDAEGPANTQRPFWKTGALRFEWALEDRPEGGDPSKGETRLG